MVNLPKKDKQDNREDGWCEGGECVIMSSNSSIMHHFATTADGTELIKHVTMSPAQGSYNSWPNYASSARLGMSA